MPAAQLAALACVISTMAQGPAEIGKYGVFNGRFWVMVSRARSFFGSFQATVVLKDTICIKPCSRRDMPQFHYSLALTGN